MSTHDPASPDLHTAARGFFFAPAKAGFALAFCFSGGFRLGHWFGSVLAVFWGMNTDAKKVKMRSGGSAGAVLERAKEEGRGIISPSEAPTEAGEDPEGFANAPLDGSALNTASSDGTTKPTGAMFWLGMAALGGAAWYFFGGKKKSGRKKKARRK